MISKVKIFLIGFVFFAAINGCFNNNKKNTPDVSKVKTNIHFYRFDKDFHSLNAENYAVKFPELQLKYKDFLKDYCVRMMGFNAKDSTTLRDEIIAFNADTIVSGIFDDIEKKFTNESFESELTKAITYYQYYFPKKSITEVITTATILRTNERGNGAMAYGDTSLVIALDMYMGKDNDKYRFAEFPEYIIDKFSPEYITPNCMEVIYLNNYGVNTTDFTNIQAMVEAGKMLYFSEMMMPAADDSLIIGYKQTQLKWCKENEKQIWKFLSEKDLLVKNDYQDQKRLIGAAPTTVGMPAEAPGKVGAWVGWQIVRKFAKENPTISFQELIEKTTPQTIIDKANYKP